VSAVLNEAVNDLATERPPEPFAWLSARLAKASKVAE
jgi:hypothetical protein